MSEAEWRMRKYVPTVEQYMSNAVVSFTLGPIVLTSLYFVGPKLSGCVIQDQEYKELFRLTSTIGRLLNDILGLEVFGFLLSSTSYLRTSHLHMYSIFSIAA